MSTLLHRHGSEPFRVAATIQVIVELPRSNLIENKRVTFSRRDPALGVKFRVIRVHGVRRARRPVRYAVFVAEADRRSGRNCDGVGLESVVRHSDHDSARIAGRCGDRWRRVRWRRCRHLPGRAAAQQQHERNERDSKNSIVQSLKPPICLNYFFVHRTHLKGIEIIRLVGKRTVF